ncbi:exodeoxyribonuclease VII large subunit [Oenococcus kitaharae]|uniref:Exodeoxyribonuclease 7 large subunit n=1 Tax=Oenococcus kitaharae DSM 17330 TaxID=1045004 RepID=G9WJU7_9LACO|nr:exodeoxyribonuclease VII large subunit [Oenococcus kitaharae]EHN59296.1 Exodeoxyribonuclease VII large subunit [Oenococcus kitaharae DSM 17330]OEY82183.1 exodeoxyribonuclease VII large subunit [Oenococcus kitaharae]OEY82606.1 exodeoxyribonuclease VII large subunit [Oenococcus kitaharae]OEY84862.1 exodeoxyribonuclease VII large subunit [Oenococcus kitaharae]
MDDDQAQEFLTVGALNRYLGAKFSHDPYLKQVSVIGEIFGYKISGFSAYFDLRDEDESSIRAYVSPTVLRRLSFDFKSGDKVNLTGSVRLYEKRAYASLLVLSMQPAGLGELYLKLAEIKNRLTKEGLFNKPVKPLSFFPKKVAVVTSKTGAVIHDIQSTIGHRNPNLAIQLYESVVQGDKAVAELIAAVKQADQSDADAIIIARGGGSMLDLWPFNDEQLVRLVANLSKPVISSIGHQTDVTLVDLAADYRVETPTAAGVKVTPAISDYQAILNQMTVSMSNNIRRSFKNAVTQFDYLANSAALKSFDQVFINHEQKLQNLNLQMLSAFNNHFQRANQGFLNLVGKLDALSPLKVLDRGFSVTFKDGLAVKDSQQLQVADQLKIIFAKGSALAEVKEINHDRSI